MNDWRTLHRAEAEPVRRNGLYGAQNRYVTFCGEEVSWFQVCAYGGPSTCLRCEVVLARRKGSPA